MPYRANLRLIARITSCVQASFIQNVFSWGTKPQIPLKNQMFLMIKKSKV